MTDHILEFTELLRSIVDDRYDGKVSAAEKAAGVKIDTIRNIFKSGRTNGPTLRTARALADGLGFEFYIGPRRSTDIPATAAARDDEFAKVDRYLVELSAGPGRNGDNAEKTAPLAFRADWMRQRGLEVSQCIVVSVKGDSMAPALAEGDLVLIDRTKRPLRNMHIYAFVDADGDAKVKRFELGDDQLLIRSDNPAHPTVVLSGHDADAINMIGKVVWSGHELPR